MVYLPVKFRHGSIHFPRRYSPCNPDICLVSHYGVRIFSGSFLRYCCRSPLCPALRTASPRVHSCCTLTGITQASIRLQLAKEEAKLGAGAFSSAPGLTLRSSSELSLLHIQFSYRETIDNLYVTAVSGRCARQMHNKLGFRSPLAPLLHQSLGVVSLFQSQSTQSPL